MAVAENALSVMIGKFSFRAMRFPQSLQAAVEIVHQTAKRKKNLNELTHFLSLGSLFIVSYVYPSVQKIVVFSLYLRSQEVFVLHFWKLKIAFPVLGGQIFVEG